MSEIKAIFTLDGTDLILKCSREDKMRDICQKYSTKVDKNIDTLLFFYEGNKVNFDLSFNAQVGSSDRSKNEIKILVQKNENTTDDNIKLNELNNKDDLMNSKKDEIKNDNLNNK